jgi:hypothetical protein
MNLPPSASYATVFGAGKAAGVCHQAGPCGESASRSNGTIWSIRTQLRIKELCRKGKSEQLFSDKLYDGRRQLPSLGHRCDVVARSLIATKAGDRGKPNRRDSTMLARSSGRSVEIDLRGLRLPLGWGQKRFEAGAQPRLRSALFHSTIVQRP